MPHCCHHLQTYWLACDAKDAPAGNTGPQNVLAIWAAQQVGCVRLSICPYIRSLCGRLCSASLAVCSAAPDCPTLRPLLHHLYDLMM